MMKKLLLFLMFFMSFSSINAQIQKYKASEFAYKYVNGWNQWTDWTDWISCVVYITMDLNEDIIKIYSNKTQSYLVVKYVNNFIDNTGGKQAKYEVIDQDGDRGIIRLRVERNGNSQLYVEFSDIMWVYSNLIRI